MTKRQSCQMPQFGVTSRGMKSLKGMIVPKKTNMLELSNMSNIVGNGNECVFFENQPSWANPTPAPKATRKSSDPRMEPIPTQRMASSR